uniref:Uncharacterized protein n=1 Tax=Schistocephalus solidus TaxID=70667 RepID=A0A0X3Q576_SCHSO
MHSSAPFHSPSHPPHMTLHNPHCVRTHCSLLHSPHIPTARSYTEPYVCQIVFRILAFVYSERSARPTDSTLVFPKNMMICYLIVQSPVNSKSVTVKVAMLFLSVLQPFFNLLQGF